MNNIIKQQMILLVKARLPEFVEAVKKAEIEGDTEIILHQDAFAVDYQEEELILLGAFIKYAGEHNVNLHIIGKNRETI